MRTRTICLTLAAVLICPVASAQWFPQNSGTTRSLNGVTFTDANTGTVVGDSGTILRTTDGGANWTLQPSGTTMPLGKVLFLNANLGWAVGDSGTIIHTTNGGASWTSQNSGTTNNLRGVSFPGAMTGWVVGGNWTILHTTNGGEDWTSVQTNIYTESLRSVHFVNQDTGFAVGNYPYVINSRAGAILRTTNGGMSWETPVVGASSSELQMTRLESTERCAFWTSEYYPRVRFNDDLTGWILRVDILAYYGGEVFCGSSVLNTTNTGATWSWTTGGFDGKLTSFHFASSFTGWAVGTAGLEGPGGEEDTTAIWFTTDAGSTWNIQFITYPGPKLEDICFVDNTNGWAVGDGGTILHTTNGGVTSVGAGQNGVPQQYLLSQNYPNPFNPTTTIRYQVPSISIVTLRVFDLLGREVATLVNERKNPGIYEVQFDGSRLSSGVYLYRLEAGGFVQTKKLVLMK